MSRQNTNRPATHIEVEHEIVKQSSQIANSYPSFAMWNRQNENGLVLAVETAH